MSNTLGGQAVELRLGTRSAAKAPTERIRDVRLVGLIKDYTRTHHRAPFAPGLSAAFRLLLLVRVFSAMYSTIADCDETFNYWEPLHLLTHPAHPNGPSQSPFQTWEYSPQYAIRSWVYIAQYVPIAGWLVNLIGSEKRVSFFATRVLLAFISSFCEASLTTAVAEVVSPRAAKYMLVFLLFSAGMYESATALLPSTFTMYTTTFALSYAFYPSRSGSEHHPSSNNVAYTPKYRTAIATFVFALGALVGWPFALVLALPFVFEEIFLPSGLIVSGQRYTSFIVARLSKWSQAVFIASLIGIPLLLIDTLAYGRFTLVPLNIIVYNILSSARGAGPELYGTEPWYYYLLNLTLNFGPTLPLALVSIPAVLFTTWYDPQRIASIDSTEAVKAAQKGHTDADAPKKSSGKTLLLLRLSPLYIWLGLLTLQPHKEERFLFPAYPLLCFNAAVTLCLARGLLERWYTNATRSPYRASKTHLFSAFTGTTLLVTSMICLSRIVHTSQAYHAPISLLNHFAYHELPRVVASAYPHEQSALVQDRLLKGLPPVYSAEERYNMSGKTQYQSSGVEKEEPKVKLSPLTRDMGEEPLRLCYGKEWFRFPTTYLVPNGVSIGFVKSEFNGILPKHFITEAVKVADPDEWLGWLWPWKETTRAMQSTFNDMNREESDQYVDLSTCDYLIDVDYLVRPTVSDKEPRHVQDAEQWSQVKCLPFLDGPGSHARPGASLMDKLRATVDRVLWLPKALRGDTNQYGDYCLLRTTRETSLANVKVL